MSAVPAGNPLAPSLIEPLKVRFEEEAKRFKVASRSTREAKGRSDDTWKYVESLESQAVELVQLVELQGIDFWTSASIEAAVQFKEELWHEMEQLKSAARHFHRPRGWKEKCRQFLIDWLPLSVPYGGNKSDRLMVSCLEKSQKFLNFHFQTFQHQYAQYRQLSQKVDEKMLKMHAYPVLNSLDAIEQARFKQLYRWLNLWEENLSVQGLPKEEFIPLVLQVSSKEHALALFKTYYASIKEQLFDLSRGIKKEPAKQKAPAKKQQIGDLPLSSIAKQHMELHTLGATIEKYRKFLLCNDPDPYVSTRGGFPEWTIGQEPRVVTLLVALTYDVEALDRLHKQFHQGLEGKIEAASVADVQAEVDAILHAMTHPLLSKGIMHAHAEKFVKQMEALGEIFSRDSRIVEFFTHSLLKAMKLDWRWQTLFDSEGFHALYHTHMAILGEIDAPPHQKRLQRFQKHIAAIDAWVKAKLGPRDFDAIAAEIDGLKQSLENFNAEFSKKIQADHLDPSMRTSARQKRAQELLEYRYLFGRFFHDLRLEEHDDMRIRNQFLFVDHALSESNALSWRLEQGTGN